MTFAFVGRSARRSVIGWILGAVLLLFSAAPAWALTADVIVSTNRSTSASNITSPSFSTTSAAELLLAFVATDAKSPGITVTSMSGAGLTWVLVRRTNVQLGTAEIWRAFAPAKLSGVTVRANLSQSVAASITVVTFIGADTSGTSGAGAIGATGSGNANPGAPSASLVTTRDNSWVFGVGNDFDNATVRTVPSDQTMVNQYLATVGDTYWVQRQNSPTGLSGTTVTINDMGPAADRYNLTIVEVRSAPASGATYTVSGAITPKASGSGATLTLSGASAATVTADVNGNYTFTGLANGGYTVTPTKAGFTFTPVSRAVTVNGASLTAINFTAAAAVTHSITGTISPAANGSGATVTLSGAAAATVTAGGNGSYTFTGLANGSYTVTPTKGGFTFTPVNRAVTVNGANVTAINFSAAPTSQQLNYPDLSVIIPTGRMSVVGSGNNRVFQYTHDTFNGGNGPLVIQPVYNPASGAYLGTQYVYSFNVGTWTLVRQIPIAGGFVFDTAHGHFHFPFVTFGLYTVAANGGPGTSVAISQKDGFCIADSFIYDPSLPNAGALGNLGSCSDPTSLRGLDIGAVDEYDQTDEGQSISLAGVPDGAYWLRSVVDPDNFLFEGDKSNNETDVLLTISGNAVTEHQRVTPVLPPPPSITLTSPSDQTQASGTVPLVASTATGTAVQFLLDGQALGSPVATPYTLPWDTTTVPDGPHWLAVQTTDATSGRTGTSPVAKVTVSNGGTHPPVVTVSSPDAGTTVFAVTAVGATVATAVPITSVQFYVDGVPVGAPLTAPPYLIYWDTRAFLDGPHVLTASATDSFNLTGTSAPVTVTVDSSHPPNTIGIDATVYSDASGTMTTPAFSTTTNSDLLVAFVAYDGPSNAPQTASVSGASLPWTLLKRSNAQDGTSEIWAVKTSDFLTNVTVTSQPGVSGYHGSLVVVAFTNAAGPGIVGQASAPSGPPDIYLPGVSAGDWVFAVGNDWDSAVGRAPVGGQVLVHQRIDSGTGDTYWVQSTAAPSTATGLVDIHDNSPTTDQWNYAAVEIVATRQ